MDSGTSLYEKLLTQCKSNGKHTYATIHHDGLAGANCLPATDVDAKVDALTKLQAQFEQGGIEVRRVSESIHAQNTEGQTKSGTRYRGSHRNPKIFSTDVESASYERGFVRPPSNPSGAHIAPSRRSVV